MVKTRLKAQWLGLVFVLTNGCYGMNNATKFEWYASEAGCGGYPVTIVKGTFLYKGDDKGLYVPSGTTPEGVWGKYRSSHATGTDPRPLPDRLDVTFYSYLEQQGYHAKIDLPYEKILTMFRMGPLPGDDKKPYRKFVVGGAPGGAIAVWIDGLYQEEIYFGQAEKVNVSISQALGQGVSDEQKFLDEMLRDGYPTFYEMAKKNQIPFGLWARYRNPYKWVPVFAQGKSLLKDHMRFQHLNGDFKAYPYPFTDELANTPRALPRYIQMRASHGAGNKVYEVTFNDIELMEAFEKLGKNGELVYVEFDPLLPPELMRIRVYNEKESISLTKFKMASS